MDPPGWLARMSDHIPDPGQQRTLFYGEYSSRVRGSGAIRRARGAGRGAASAPQAQLTQLGTLDRQGLPGRPARVHSLRQAHEPHRLRHRPGGDREDPRPPRPQHSRGGEAATAGAGAPPRRRAGRRLGRPGAVGVSPQVPQIPRRPRIPLPDRASPRRRRPAREQALCKPVPSTGASLAAAPRFGARRSPRHGSPIVSVDASVTSDVQSSVAAAVEEPIDPLKWRSTTRRRRKNT